MAEVDNIIIASLKNLNCEIDEEITSLKQFDADLTVAAVSTCLGAIVGGGASFPKTLPPTMSHKLKLATMLAEQIKDLGFRGDMGYQTILYCNEIEIRRVLMFLIERLPVVNKESPKATETTTATYVPRLVKEIEDKMRGALRLMWLPTNVLGSSGTRPIINNDNISTAYCVNSFGNSCGLRTENLIIPDCTYTDDDGRKDYYNRIVPDVTRQCSNPRHLITSLLFKDNEFTGNFHTKLLPVIDTTNIRSGVSINSNGSSTDQSLIDQENCKIMAVTNDDGETSTTTTTNYNNSEQIDRIKVVVGEIEQGKEDFLKLQEAVRTCELQLSQMESIRAEEESQLKSTESRIKIKSKTLTVLGKDENRAKLRALVANANERLLDLTNQWNQVQTPLLTEYRALRDTVTIAELEKQQMEKKIKQMEVIESNLVQDLRDKDQLERQLRAQYEQQIKQGYHVNGRAGYTKRILEIIANIKKQNTDIQNVLGDTRQVQKDISALTGQVDRSFTMSDELIYRDARYDETARRAYKLLASLRDECGDLIKAVSDLGAAERESRNIEDQVEAERAKGVEAKLERVERDLQEMRNDNQGLLNRLKGL